MIIYQRWVRYYSKSLQIIPKELNKLFVKYTLNSSNDFIVNNDNDFNFIVDHIIEISPPYNHEKIDKKIGQNKEKDTLNVMQKKTSIKKTSNKDLFIRNDQSIFFF